MYKSKGNQYKQARYDQGLCVNCTSPRDTKKALCADCRKDQSTKSKARYAAKSSQGICRSCPSPLAPNSESYCYRCWFRKICIDRTGNAKLAGAIQALFEEQDGKCAYTGKTIRLGVNAQLDHKTPSPKGGKNEIKNLHWVSADINLMKGNRTHKEFVALCGLISHRFD